VTSPVWEDGDWDDLPTLDGDRSTDVCVVGLGGSGLAAVGRLQELGHAVIGIDAGSIGGGAAGRNGGFLLAGAADFHHDAVAAWGRDRAVAFYRRTLVELDRMTAETPTAIRRDGSLRVAESAEEMADCRRQLATMKEDDLPAEWYEGKEGEGLLIPTDGVFQPLARCRALARTTQSRGALLCERSPATSIQGDRVVTPHGTIHCGVVVVAIDGRLEQVIPELRGRIRTARLQMLATVPTAELRTPFAVYSRYGYEYWQQLADGSVALGGMRDRGGEGEWTDVAEPAEPVQGLLEALLRDRLGVQAAISHRWAGVVGYSGDGLPVLEEVRPRVWVTGGYSGTGNVVGAICGRAAADLAVSGASADREIFRS
jgi:glycine/D-amino acid oxidase-like deaminating enzyme